MNKTIYWIGVLLMSLFLALAIHLLKRLGATQEFSFWTGYVMGCMFLFVLESKEKS